MVNVTKLTKPGMLPNAQDAKHDSSVWEIGITLIFTTSVSLLVNRAATLRIKLKTIPVIESNHKGCVLTKNIGLWNVLLDYMSELENEHSSGN